MNIGNRIRRDTARLLASGGLNSVSVTVHYEAPLSAGQAAVDPWMESDGSRTAQGAAVTTTLNAFFHEISPESVAQRGYTEIAAGDAILDFAESAPVATWRNARFEIGDRWWTQKTVGKDLALTWDAHAGGKATVHSILITPDK